MMKLKTAALAASIALSLGTATAYAATPTATQLPGMGQIVSGAGTVTGSAVTTAGGVSTLTVDVAGNAVISWGTGTDINADLSQKGFNVGTKGVVQFSTAATGAVLNIDASGAPSQILGKVTGAKADVTGSAADVSVFVANSNGIIVGSGASISAGAGEVGLISNTLKTTGLTFGGTEAGLVYDGNGGDVTVTKGAKISGATTFISGGGTVNVDFGSFAGVTGDVTVNAGLNSGSTTTGFKSTNTSAVINLTGDGSALSSTSVIDSAGDLNNAGTANAINLNAGGTLNNAAGATLNWGTAFIDGVLNNAGTVTATDTITTGGLVNTGKITGDQDILVKGGSINNTGTIAAGNSIKTQESGAVDATGKSTEGGKDYSITNGGVISFNTLVAPAADVIDANSTQANKSTGSFTNTGILNVNASGDALTLSANNDINLAGALQAGGTALDGNTTSLGAVSLTSKVGGVTVGAPVLSDATVALSGATVAAMADVAGTTGTTITANAKAADLAAGAYAVRIAKGVTVSDGASVTVGGANTPDVIVQGTVQAPALTFGTTTAAINNLYTGPEGSLEVVGNSSTGTSGALNVAFTGAVKTVPYNNNTTNWRYNGLIVSAVDGATAPGTKAFGVDLTLDPVAFATSGSPSPFGNAGTGKSSVNVLVNGDVQLKPSTVATATQAAGSTAVNANPVNTHLVLQSTGNITTSGNYYWPGYVYLGNIDVDADGNALPGSLSATNGIAFGGDFNNVLAGSTALGGGLHFITNMPLTLGGNVVTNANAWISFGSQALTTAYAGGLDAGKFFAGAPLTSTITQYGAAKDAPNFQFSYQAPDSSDGSQAASN